MNPDPLEARLARLPARPPAPALRARVLGAAQPAWAEGAADRRAWGRRCRGLAGAASAVAVIVAAGTSAEEYAMSRRLSGMAGQPAAAMVAWAHELGVDPRYAEFLARVSDASAHVRLSERIGASAWSRAGLGGES